MVCGLEQLNLKSGFSGLILVSSKAAGYNGAAFMLTSQCLEQQELK